MEPLTSAVAVKAIAKPLNDIYELGKDRFKTTLLKAKTNANITKIHKQISATHKVKTIWQIDKEVSLKSFYYPSKIIIEEEATTISSIKKIPQETNTVIQGIVGQGKSIFLRYLSYQETNSGQRIPLFFELRRIEGSETLEENIKKLLANLNFEAIDDIYDFLLNSGKLVLLLDGFDEIPSDKVSRIIFELEDLSQKYENLKIIITSRPDSGIEQSAYFRVYRLAPLQPKDIPGFLSKIIDNKEKRAALNKAIEDSTSNIKGLLTTPLMLTLLVLVYKSENKIPEQLSEFYENLFSLLLSRHDKSKPGYVRERATKLNERKLQQLFEAFCFVTRRKELTTIGHSEIHSTVEEAIHLTGMECDSSSFLKDITKVSNLILEEGYSYHFIHKSIQEFYAANYISSRPEELVQKFYITIAGLRHRDWIQEVNFLSQIDSYRYTKYLYTPNVSTFLSNYEINPYSDWKGMQLALTNKALTQLHVRLSLNQSESLITSYNFGNMSLDYRAFDFASALMLKLMRTFPFTEGQGFKKIAEKIKDGYIPSKTIEDNQTEHAIVSATFYDLISFLGKIAEAQKIVVDAFRELYDEFQTRKHMLEIEDNSLLL